VAVGRGAERQLKGARWPCGAPGSGGSKARTAAVKRRLLGGGGLKGRRWQLLEGQVVGNDLRDRTSTTATRGALRQAVAASDARRR
jgi:hypothetical protein